jgi:O-antigen/teichoic acid export membrane protein
VRHSNPQISHFKIPILKLKSLAIMSKRALLLNSLSGVALLVTEIVVAFVMSPIIVRELGNQSYGVWELLVGLVGYLGLLELGTGPALIRYVADAWSREDRAALERIFNTGLFTLAGAGLIGLLVFLVGTMWPEHLLNLRVSEARELVSVLLVFGLNLAVSLPSTALSAYLLGLQAHRFINLLRIILSVTQAFVIYHVLIAGWQPQLIWMGSIMLCGTVLQSLLWAVWIVVVDRKVRIAVSSFSVTMFKELFSYGAKSMILMAAVGILKRLVSFVIAHTAGVGQVVYFAIPNRLVEYAQSLGLALGYPLTPFFADIEGKGDRAATRQVWFQTTRILQIVTLGAPLAAAGFGEPFIRVWMGQEYAERGKWVFYILCAGLFVQGIASNCNRILLSLGRHGRLAMYSAILAPGFFLASLGLGIRWGIEGVAAAVSLFAATVAALEITFACHALGVSLSNHFRATVLRFTIPITATGTILIGLQQVAYPRCYEELLLHALAACTMYLVAVWFAVLDLEERKLLRKVVAERGRDRSSDPKAIMRS